MADADQSLVITGRVGHADFLNGQYDLQEEVRKNAARDAVGVVARLGRPLIFIFFRLTERNCVLHVRVLV